MLQRVAVRVMPVHTDRVVVAGQCDRQLPASVLCTRSVANVFADVRRLDVGCEAEADRPRRDLPEMADVGAAVPQRRPRPDSAESLASVLAGASLGTRRRALGEGEPPKGVA